MKPNPNCEYANDGARITQPGKFEGEPVFAPYFWQLAMEGFADGDHGRVVKFRVGAKDKEHDDFPTLRAWLGRKRTLCLREDGNGFVHCFTK